jgi:hypothetical protein
VWATQEHKVERSWLVDHYHRRILQLEHASLVSENGSAHAALLRRAPLGVVLLI